MKAGLLALLFLLLPFSALPQAGPPAGPLVTEKFSQAALPEIFRLLEEKYRVRIFYKQEWLPAEPVSRQFVALPLEEVLRQLLGGQPFYFLAYQPQVWVLMPGKRDAPPADGAATAPAPGKSITTALIQGKVQDAQTGEPLQGVMVLSSQHSAATATNEAGAFRLRVPAGVQSLTISLLGYEQQNQEVEASAGPSNLQFSLYKKTAHLSEVMVVGKRLADNVDQVQAGVVKLEINALKKMPAFLGEVDVVKSIKLLPGVNSVGEAATGFNVRGGNVDQNLVLLDDAPIFNASHLFGFFSIFNPSAVNEVTLHRGGIPAQYGGRLASVLEVSQREGDYKKFSAHGGLGLITGRLAVEGPLVKDKTSFLVAARSSYSNWLLHQLPDPELKQSKASFYDLSAKIGHMFNESNRLAFSVYQSADDFGFARDTTYKWQTRTATLKYTHFFNHNFLVDVGAVWSDYRFQILQTEPYNASQYQNGINSKSLKADFTYTLPSQEWRFGAQLQQYGFQPGQIRPASALSQILPESLQTEQSQEDALYFNHEYNFSPRFSVMYGLRYSYFRNFGKGQVYVYEAGLPKKNRTIIDTLQIGAGETIASYHGPEPRLSLKFNWTDNAAFKLGYHRGRQYLHLVSNTTAASPLDIWKTSNAHIKPQLGDQLSLGYFQNIAQNTYEFSLETYYKQVRQVLDYKNGASLFFNPALEADLLAGRGKAYGLETIVTKKTGLLSGWLSYTYARTLLQVDGPAPEEKINFGQYYPANYDKPHTFNLVSIYQYKKRLSLGANFTYSSGRPVSAPAAFYAINDQIVVPVYGLRNAVRIPAYHRLDLSFAIQPDHQKDKKWAGTWNISVYNVYGRKNPYSVFFKQNTATAPQMYQLAVIGMPLPSITYDFKFYGAR